MSKTAAQFTAEQQNAAREQIIINTRLTALQAALDVMQLQGYHGDTTAEERIKMAKQFEAYVLADVEAVKPKSTLVLQTNMPPPGVFKPGQ